MEYKIKLTAERLRIARDKKQWSYGMLSDATGFSKSTLQRYETGFVQNIPVEILKIIGAALGVRPEWLMGFDEPEKKDSLELDEEQQNALILYSQLDPIDRAEIRGMMKQMLRADKYSDKSNSKLA